MELVGAVTSGWHPPQPERSNVSPLPGPHGSLKGKCTDCFDIQGSTYPRPSMDSFLIKVRGRRDGKGYIPEAKFSNPWIPSYHLKDACPK